MELRVPSDRLLEGGVLVGRYLTRKLGARAIPLVQPNGREQLVPARRRCTTGRGRECDCRFQFLSSAASSRNIKSGGEQRGTVGGRAGVGEKFGGAPRASVEQLAKRSQRPLIAGGLGRKHIVKDEVRRSRSCGHCFEEIARPKQPAQTRVLPGVPLTVFKDSG